ncbi:DUF4956 domain-containing protein [Pseudonocardia sp. DSM 110487]|uniref:DUF4956 domain-containing protein n=1 Tax=Pseudonocardia sp. DSM 110487 TaxID=2865833 RepID=UPI002107FA4C|nr:DUF4956 domain-containing protein [Pseudonocardia sp. DSM 110487]
MNVNDLISQAIAQYSGFGIELAIDLVGILLMAYVLYFRRHWRADLLLSYVTLNIGIFVVMSVLSTVRVDIAIGFGLFAILSIIRLRSSAVTQQEVAYYFVALVMGLINGLDVADRALVIALNVLLLVVMAVFDSKPLRDRSRRLDVHLKGVYDSDAALVADLERELGGRIMYHEVTEIDLGRQHTTVDVRYRPGAGVSRQGRFEALASEPVAPPELPAERAEHLVSTGARDNAQNRSDRMEVLVPTGARDSGENRSDRVE